MFKRILTLAVIGLLRMGWGDAASASPPASDSPPAIPREFRGLWVATVDNIDWPSRRGLSTRQQQEELIALLDRAASLHLNAVILQVRPCCDAFYASTLEPWSEYLTGKSGQAPSPYYDPLAFAVTEAHRRGLELHAWFNPYRVSIHGPYPSAAGLPHPELVRAYGKSLWLDPAEEGTRQYSSSVILDVVRRYDIDGVHFDDYFYPYPEKTEQGKPIEFPDEASWGRYETRGGKLSRSDWRRENVDRFVESIYRAIKKEKPWVKFGISPFGIWHPFNPPQITGFDAYNGLFADARKWLAEGWVDYLSPQLYWPIEQKAQSFPVLLQWWASQNIRHRSLWPGMRLTGWKGMEEDAGEAVREIEVTRAEGASGALLWHAKPLLRDENGVAGALRHKVYGAAALVPSSPWLCADNPEEPYLRAEHSRDELKLNWKPASAPVWQWVLQKKAEGRWTTEILPGQVTSISLAAVGTNGPEMIALCAVNRYGNLSPFAIFHARP
jgi:uncharacterized lipoprotein YddW (UPF0748 family)